jgi:transcription initiation factor TFIIIB Brf1 subunit/transcription initiation factor TFIIB
MVSCPTCGGHLESQDAAGEMTCTSCGTVHEENNQESAGGTR